MAPRRQTSRSDQNPIFVGREALIGRFETALLNIPADSCSLLTFYGPGGQGKTKLCRELVRRSDYRVNADFDFIKRAHLDLHDKLKTDADKVLIWIRNAFAKYTEKGLSFPTFDLAFSYYWEEVREAEHPPRLINPGFHTASDAVGEAGMDIGEFLGDLWKDSIDTIPGVKTIYRWVSQKGLKRGQEIYLKYARPEVLAELFDDRGQPRDVQSIKRKLAWFLAQDLNHYLKRHPQSRFVLLIDEYERIASEGGASTALEDNLFDNNFRKFIAETDGLLTVFFSRERLDWEKDPDWVDDLSGNQISLGGLNDPDADKWLVLEEIQDDDIRAAMINGARETSAPEAKIYPLLLDLQIEHYQARVDANLDVKPDNFVIEDPSFSGRCRELLQRVLRDYDENMQSTLKRLSVAERFDKSAFAFAIDHFQTGLSLDRFDRLKTLSFITEDEDGFLLIHRAVRDVMLSWLEEDYKTDSIAPLLKHFTERTKFDPLEKAPDTELLALNQAFELRLMQGPENLNAWLFEIEKPFHHRSKFTELEILWRRTLDFLSSKDGVYEADTATSYNNVAYNLNAQGRYEEAEPLYRRGLEIRECVLGADHPDTAASYNNVASNLNAQGRYEEAEPLYRRGLEIRERVLGEDHPSTATSYNNVAFNLDHQGRYEEAEPLYRRGLEILERVLGADHPDTAASYNNVAYNLNAQGRYEEAEPLYRRGLEISQRVLGPEHPHTKIFRSNYEVNKKLIP